MNKMKVNIFLIDKFIIYILALLYKIYKKRTLNIVKIFFIFNFVIFKNEENNIFFINNRLIIIKQYEYRRK